MIGTELPQASIHVVEGHSLVIPLIVDGLPESAVALGRRWQRKREFHLTALAARALDAAGVGSQDWDIVVRVASGRRLGPVALTPDVRRVSQPDEPELQTLIAMATCPGLETLIAEAAGALRVDLPVPPAHVTLYSSDAARGIGIVDAAELEQRAPELSQAERAEILEALRTES